MPYRKSLRLMKRRSTVEAIFLVDSLAKEWGVRHEEQGGKTVWATIPL